jgi:hypothetical protein
MIFFEYTANGIIARGLLINYDYVTKISKGTDCAVGRQDLTVRQFVSLGFAKTHIPPGNFNVHG